MPQPFGAQYLRQHQLATGWDPDAHYSQLTRTSRALLDFSFAPGLHFSLSQAAVPQVANSLSLSALSNALLDGSAVGGAGTGEESSSTPGAMTGSLTYVMSSRGVKLRSSRETALRDVVERFRIPTMPDQRVGQSKLREDSSKDYLLYGRFHLPSYRLDALWSRNLSPTSQALVTLVSIPQYSSRPPGSGTSMTSSAPAYPEPPLASAPGIFELTGTLTQDTGKWATQYSYSTVDGLAGARVLHHFGASRRAPPSAAGNHQSEAERIRLVDEEEAMENVLRGRFSAGGEVYFSAQERSGGLSTGVRFATIPDPPGTPITQPPTVLTATLNPIMGHISASYAAKISRDVAVATRYDFNSFSFDSDLTLGLEWLQRRRLVRRRAAVPSDRSGLASWFWRSVGAGDGEVTGIVKARASPASGIAVMWEGKWRDCFVGLGLVADLSSHKRPVKAVGLELQYLKSG